MCYENVIQTPWDDTLVDALVEYQVNSQSPYVCGNELHGDKRPTLVPSLGGLVCVGVFTTGFMCYEECFYTQQWVLRSSLTI